MRRIICVPSFYGLHASWRAFMHISCSLRANLGNVDCGTPQSVRHYECACDLGTANHEDDGAAHLLHTSCQQRIGSCDRGPLLQPPSRPCSIGGTPFAYLLQRIIVDKTEKSFHRRMEAYKFLCHVASNSTTRCRVDSTEEARTREQQMQRSLRTLSKPSLLSSLQWRENPPFTVCLQRPKGHVCVPAVVGESYLFLRSQGVDVAAWWERYYNAFIRSSMAQHSGSEGATVVAGAGASGFQKSAPFPVIDDCSPNTDRDGASSPPPFYWKLDWSLRHIFCTSTTTPSSGDVLAVPLPSFEEPAPCRVSPVKMQTDVMEPSSDGLPRSRSATAAALVSPPTRQSTWIPVWLLRHLPFFPIPFPSIHMKGEQREGRGDETLHKSAALTSARLPLTLHDLDSCTTEDRERAVLQCKGELVMEADSILAQRDGVSLANASDDNFREANRRCTRGFKSWHTSQNIRSNPSLHTRTRQDQLDKAWGHPFFDDLYPGGTSNKNPRYPTLITAGGDHATALRERITEKEAPRHLRRDRECETFALDFVLSPACLPTAATTTTTSGARSAAVTVQWPSPLFQWQLRKNHWRCLSSFWATKADPANSLAEDYAFPFQAYPLLQYRSLFRVRKGRTAMLTRKPHLHSLSAGSGLNCLGKNPTFQKWARGSLNSDVAAQQHVRWRAQPSAHNSTDVGDLLNWVLPTTAPEDSAHGSNVSATARRASIFDSLLKNGGVEKAIFFGVQYVNVDSTALSCLFDSTVCVRHAVPLDVTGTVFSIGLRPTRYRQQHSCLSVGHRRMPTAEEDQSGLCAAKHGTPDRVRKTQLPMFSTAMEKLEAAETEMALSVNTSDNSTATSGDGGERGATSHAAPWLARLRAIRNECERGRPKPHVPMMERVAVMRSSQRSTSFLFQSPYWVEVAEVYERWGVRVAPGTVPLFICGKPYVNAEQTTDASRFSPSTCVPHLKQEILFTKGLGACTWAGSQSLLSLIAPGAAPRRRPGGACAWTYRTLCERATAVQQVSNLWVAESVIERFQWTLQPVPAPPRSDMSDNTDLGNSMDGQHEVLRAFLPVEGIESFRLRNSLCDEMDSEVVHRSSPCRDSLAHADGCRGATTPSTRPCKSPAVRGVLSPTLSPHTTRPQICVVHSSCVVEQAELMFMAAFSPVVLLLRVPDLTSQDQGFIAWEAAKQKADTASRSARKQATGSVNPGGGERNGTSVGAERCPSLHTDFEWEGNDEDEQSFPDSFGDDDDDVTPGVSESFLEKRARLIYAKAMRRKRFLCLSPWRAARLSFQSRLDLAHLALRKGYSPENANRWVSLDFLRDEPGVRITRTDRTQIPRRNSTYDPAIAESSSGRQAGTWPNSCAIGGIKVKVLSYSQVEPSWSRLPSEGSDYIEDDHGVCSHDGGATDDGTTALRETGMELINYEELEWPRSVVSSSKERWAWKEL
ncbi:hypothetical protein, conserved [Leishmania tarentolae]|uniref:Uncharacterized protein n=1 Tax=Leishmania tarentolae TaxID=5689 RepID=A0A640KN27_LEITA|nr:hypothetical protein, conserved [Leishmania tarentolae]